MKNALRCCISCILPCGALDVIRIVHSNGRVEEISGTVKAAEIMKMHPKHVLKKPSSPSPADGDQGRPACPKIIVVPPDAQLQRGKIYFLIPVAPPPNQPEKSRTRSSAATAARRRKKSSEDIAAAVANNVVVSTSDQYLSEILSEKLSAPRDRRRGRVGVWRPNLQSISEFPCES
nr:phosphatidylinositol 4-phosphate 5-kinase MSS4-like protein [Ipomoea batatas]